MQPNGSKSVSFNQQFVEFLMCFVGIIVVFCKKRRSILIMLLLIVCHLKSLLLSEVASNQFLDDFLRTSIVRRGSPFKTFVAGLK